MTVKTLFWAAVVATVTAAPALASTITPHIIFGSGNANRGFTVATEGDIEIGLRAKQRFTAPNDEIGVGIVQDSSGNYLFDSTGQVVPADRSVWNYDWSINTDTADGSMTLADYAFLIEVDFDASAAEDMRGYDPLSALSTGYYLGTNASPEGGAAFDSGGDDAFDAFNVAQNSVNMGFIGAPLGAGQYRVALSVFDIDSDDLIATTSINVYVDTDPAVIPLPATLPILLAGLAGFGALRRLQRRTS
ncbi:MAG: VPLPA-CTERM sorting domain-containing protein [Pseudomonadota bacterium]